ncbi:hypothetical protein HDU91_004067 [Kappamyces sp. JEL0680]|nr:hypothetical protein HDU91_004067 [Kappamyces sp. JEL0680]
MSSKLAAEPGCRPRPFPGRPVQDQFYSLLVNIQETLRKDRSLTGDRLRKPNQEHLAREREQLWTLLEQQRKSSFIPLTLVHINHLKDLVLQGHGPRDNAMDSLEYLLEYSLETNQSHLVSFLIVSLLKFAHHNSLEWNTRILDKIPPLTQIPHVLVLKIAKTGNVKLTNEWIDKYVQSWKSTDSHGYPDPARPLDALQCLNEQLQYIPSRRSRTTVDTPGSHHESADARPHGAPKQPQAADTVPSERFVTQVILNCILVVNSAKQNFNAFDFVAFMRKYNALFDANQYTSILHAYSKNSPDAFGTMYREIQQYRFRRTIGYYTAVTNHYLMKEGNADEAKKIFQQLLAEKVPFDRVFLNSFMNGLFHCGMPEEAIRIFRHFDEFDIKPDNISYTTLIANCVRNSKRLRVTLDMFHAAMGFYNEFRTFNNKLSLWTWGTIIEMFSKAGEPEYAEQIFQDLCRSRVCQPSPALYYNVIFGYLNKRDFKSAVRLHQQFIKTGHNPETLNTFQLYTLANTDQIQNGDSFLGIYEKCFGKMLDYFEKHGKPDPFAAKFYDFLVHSTYKYSAAITLHPTISKDMAMLGLSFKHLYHAFVSTHARAGDVKYTWFWIKLMEEEGIPLSNHAYDDVLILLSKEGQWEKGLKLVENYLAQGNPPTQLTIQVLLLAAMARDPGDTKGVLKIISGYPKEAWNSRTYAILIQFYASNNQWTEACRLWSDYLEAVRLGKQSYRPDVVRAFLSWCIVNDEQHHIRTIWKDIIDQNRYFIPEYYWHIELDTIPKPFENSVAYQEHVLGRKAPAGTLPSP